MRTRRGSKTESKTERPILLWFANSRLSKRIRRELFFLWSVEVDNRKGEAIVGNSHKIR